MNNFLISLAHRCMYGRGSIRVYGRGGWAKNKTTSHVGLQVEWPVLLCGAPLWHFVVVEVGGWCPRWILGGIETAKALILKWVFSHLFRIFNKPPICATIWISYLGIAIFTSSRIKHEIGLYQYQRGTNNKWTYDLTNHLMIDLETIYIVNLDAYELHLRHEKVFNDIICMLGFHIIHMIGVHYNSKVYFYTYVNDYIWE